jgi:hypothetical protein
MFIFKFELPVNEIFKELKTALSQRASFIILTDSLNKSFKEKSERLERQTLKGVST